MGIKLRWFRAQLKVRDNVQSESTQLVGTYNYNLDSQISYYGSDGNSKPKAFDISNENRDRVNKLPVKAEHRSESNRRRNIATEKQQGTEGSNMQKKVKSHKKSETKTLQEQSQSSDAVKINVTNNSTDNEEKNTVKQNNLLINSKPKTTEEMTTGEIQFIVPDGMCDEDQKLNSNLEVFQEYDEFNI